jgi:hypothetical protein
LVSFTRYFAAIIILLSIILLITIVDSFKLLSPTFPELSDALEKHQGLISLAGLVIVIIVFIVGQKIESNIKKNEIRRRLLTACSMISLEISQCRDAFDDQRFVVRDGINMPFQNITLNIDAYNTTLFSGLFSYFERNTQDMVKRLYQRISLHNETLLYRTKYEDVFFLYDQSANRYQLWNFRVRRYNIALNLCENDIKALIPEVERLIETERQKAIV